MAGGSGTRLWPMSTGRQPKQLIPFINGRSLLQIAFERLDGLVEPDKRYICAGNAHKSVILDRLGELSSSCFIGEPVGRDTLNALAYSAALLHKKDPDAVIAVFTADHIIEPVDEFLKIVEKGYEVVENNPDSLVTFGITPTYAATGFGYLNLGENFYGESLRVKQFKEKPDKPAAERYFSAGPKEFLWNSGMFVWKAETLLRCVKKYEPQNYKGVMDIAGVWQTEKFEPVLEDVYPGLKKVSIDFAVMEPASSDEEFNVAALPMPLTWLDIGSWSAYSEVCSEDSDGNSLGAGTSVMIDSHDCLTVSDEAGHLVAGIGLENMIVVHTKNATLVCPKDRDQDIKSLYETVKNKYGDKYI